MDFRHQLGQVAEQYRSEGYQVIVQPESTQLPPFAADLGIDLFACKGEEQVLVKVKKNRQDLLRDRNAIRLAELVGARPGYRFDLVVMGWPAGAETSTPDTADFPDGAVDEPFLRWKAPSNP